MNQSQLVKLDVVRDEPEHVIDNSVIRLIPPEVPSKGAQYEIKHGPDGLKR